MMLNPEGIPMGPNGTTEAAPDPNAALRFEDLTIDDDLSLLDRVVRYVRSGIALQRLVHVKMISDTAKTVGTTATIETIIPLLPPLVVDSESIIRQHLATQILPLCLCCMFGDEENFNPKELAEQKTRTYNSKGYKVVSSVILNHINALIIDTDMDVRKAASDALATLAMFIKPEDIVPLILPIPLRLSHDEKVRMNGTPAGGPNNNNNANSNNSNNKGKEKDDTSNDELRVTASNLLADLASVASNQIPPKMVAKYITPTIMNLCGHSSFRVRRAAVQALPRILSGSTADDAYYNIIPCFQQLAQDEMYRVRKSVGECLVDMSRSLMLLPFSKDACTSTNKKENLFAQMNQDQLKLALMDLRRRTLVNVCARLLGDQNKLVRHGMMQFLGPFIASFYPLDGPDGGPEDDGIVDLLNGKGHEHRVGGMGPQFFPHANGMVSRLNPTNLTESTSLNETPSPTKPAPDSMKYFESHLPTFLEKGINDAKSLRRILQHREECPVPQNDISSVKRTLLPAYVALATIDTGDDDTDAEMRVYCAYSLPAVVLLLGENGWEKSLKDCFLALITGWDGKKNEKGEPMSVSTVPLPVKRCLASSFHSICHMLGSDVVNASADEDAGGRDLLSIFEIQFLRDIDDTVRLNVIRNHVSFLSLLSPSKRSKYLPVLYEIIKSDAVLASQRTNALNPMVLNWRQRNMVTQILPNLLMLYGPAEIRQYLWPIIKILLCDSVNVVRENAEWSLPVMFRVYEEKNWKDGKGDVLSEAARLSSESCDEVIKYLKAILLDKRTTTQKRSNNQSKNSGAFSNRQGYCRVLTAVAISLRLNGKEFRKRRKDSTPSSPFHDYTSDEYRHVNRVLKNHLLPLAMEMKDDRVTNVRLALAKCLRFLPTELREQDNVSTVLQTLEDEIDTWEGGGGLYLEGFMGGTTSTSPSMKQKSIEQTESSDTVQSNQKLKEAKEKRRKEREDEDSKTLASI